MNSLRRTKPLKRGKRKSYGDAEQRLSFKREVLRLDGGCVMSFESRMLSHPPCEEAFACPWCGSANLKRTSLVFRDGRPLYGCRGRCYFAVSPQPWRDGDLCEGVLQASHVLPKQRLKRLGLGAHIYSPGSAICLCERHHRRHDSHRERVPRELLPERCLAFYASLDLTYALEREYPK